MNAEDLGGVAHGAPVHRAKHEDLSKPVGQGVDGALEGNLQLGVGRLGFGRRERRGGFRHIELHRREWRTAVATHAAQCLVKGDLSNPRREQHRGMQRRQMCKRAHVGVLHHVFRLGVIAQHAANHAVDLLVVSAHQGLEQRALARANAVDQLGV